MRRSSYLTLMLALSACLLSCRHDDIPGNCFVEDMDLHFVHGEYGVSMDFPEALKVVLMNGTEQIEYTFSSDLRGNVRICGVLPGSYTMNVSGNLPGGRMLSAFVSGLTLKISGNGGIQTPALTESLSSPVIFKELYYAGSKTPTGGSYRNDSFYSIYNNSDEDQDISDLYIGMSEYYGSRDEAGPLWPGEVQGSSRHVYLQSIWKIVPDDEPTVIAPGQTVTIAVMAAPHNREEIYNLASPVDLSSADYEAYVPDPENKYPDFSAPNMELTFWPAYSYLWRMSVFGQGIVLVRATREEMDDFGQVVLPEQYQDPFESDEYWICRKIPNSHVCDAVDLIKNSTLTHTKRFSPELDSGAAAIGETYSGKSLVRRRLHEGSSKLMDTNNSSEDFVINDNPGR